MRISGHVNPSWSNLIVYMWNFPTEYLVGYLHFECTIAVISANTNIKIKDQNDSFVFSYAYDG